MAMDITTLSVNVKSTGIDSTSQALENLAKSADKAEKAVDKMEGKFKNSRAGIDVVKESINSLKDILNKSFPTDGANSLTKAMKELSDAMSKIKGKNINVNFKEIGDSSHQAVKGVTSLNQSLMQGHNIFQVVGKSLYSLRNLLGGTMLAGALIEAAKSTVTLADSWTLAKARLELFLGGVEAASAAQQNLFNISQELKVPMKDMTTLFTRLVPAMQEYGYSTKDAMNVTTAMGAALKVSGATVAETSSVLLQFSQSMAAGRLNGAEFNAVAEGAPIILRLLSKELGVSRGELKKMAAGGLISTSLLTRVLNNNMKELTEQAKKMPLTVGSAFGALSDSFMKFVGEMNEGTGITGAIAAGIKLLADNLSNLFAIIEAGAVGFVAFKAGLLGYNVLIASSTVLSASLAAELGILSVASTTAAGGFALLSRAALAFITNPVVLGIAAIAAGAYYLTKALLSTESAAEKTSKAITEDLAKGDAVSAFNKQQTQAANLANQYNLLAGEINRVKKEMDAAKSLGASTKSQQEQLDGLNKKLKEVGDQLNKNVSSMKEFNREMGDKKIKESADAMEEYMEKMRSEISLGHRMTKAEEERFKLQKMIAGFTSETTEQTKLEYANKLRNAEAAIIVEKQHKAALDTNKSATKEVESAAKKAENAYLKALQSSVDFIEKQKEELALQRELTEGEKVALKLRQDAYDFANKTGRSNKELLSNIDKLEELESERKLGESINKLQSDRIEKEQRLVELQIENNKSAFENGIVGKEKLLAVQNKINETYTSEMSLQNTVVQNEEDRISFLNDQIALYKQRMDIMLLTAQAEVLVNPDDKAAQERLEKLLDLRDKMLDGLNKEISASQSKLKIEKDIQAEMIKGYQKRLDSIGRTPGAILAEGFGEAGKAISNMAKAYDVFGEQSSKINAELQAQLEYLDKTGASPEVIAKAEKAAAEKRVQINTQMYGNMASSAKGFFKQQTTEYKTLERVEKAFRALEMAMAIKSRITQVMGIETVAAAETASVPTVVAAQQVKGNAAAATGVANQAAGDPYTAIPRMAAMVAIMAALGFVVSNINGGVDPTEDRQANQGTGTVLGDVTAKSESITNAIELIEENTSVSAKYNEGMLLALKNIETALGGAAKMITRSKIGTGGDVNSYGGIDLGTMSQNSYIGKVNTIFIDKLADIDASLKKYLLPMLGGDALKKIFGVKVSVKDTGIFAQPQTVSDILEKGFSGASFTTVEKKARFRKAKQEDVFGELSEDVEKQFELVIKSLSSGLQEVGGVLDVNGEDFNNRLNNFVVDIGRISLEGLSGEEVQKQLTAVFSKLGDEMALAAIPGLDNFQEVGEGYLETLIRVASTVATVDGIFNSIGQTMQLTGMDSINAKIRLVELAGGLENLSSLVGSFYENFYTDGEKTANTTRLVSEEFSRLGIEMLDLNAKDARIRFRDLVNSYKDTNSEVYLSLLGLQDEISDLVPAFDEATSSTEENLEVLNKKLSLEARLRELTMSDIDLLKYNREQELLSMDASLVSLQKRIWALEDERVALDKLKNAAQGALSGLEKSVGAEKTKLKKDLDDKLKVIDKLKTEEDARYEAERQSIQAQAKFAEDQAKIAEDAFNAAKQAQQNSVQASLSSVQDLSNTLKELFDSIGDSVATLRKSTSAYTTQSYTSAQAQLDSALLLAKSTGVLPDATRFKEVLSALTSVDKSSFASAFDYERNQLVTAGKLEQLQGVAGSRLSAADQTIKLLENQLKSIDNMSFTMSSNNDNLLIQAEEQHKLNIDKLEEAEKLLRDQYEIDVFYLDGILENAKTQLEIANGTYVAITDIETALETYNDNLNAYIEKQAGKDEILAQIGAMTNKVSSIDIPSMQVKDEELAAKIEQMSNDMKAANRTIAENTLKTAKILDRWDGDGQPEQRVI